MPDLTPEDIVLLVADGTSGQTYSLDPVRVMKGAFLASKKGRAEWQGLFRFRPYDYGPFDSSVYGVCDRLVADGLIEVDPRGRYKRYLVTDEGRRRVQELEDEHGECVAGWLSSVGAWVGSRPFAKLLREIYAEYPEYAVRTIFRD